MSILKSKSIKWILGIIGVIFVGALGSGTWESILSPLFSSITKLILNVTTFGLTKYKNIIYIEIAKGFSEKPSVYLWCLVILLFCAFIFTVITRKIISNLIDRRLTTEKAYKRFKLFFVCYSIFFIVYTITYAAKTIYINEAITYFKQLNFIICPYIKPEENQRLISKFAQITKKEDYQVLVEGMEKIASQNNLKIPKFKIW